MRTTLDLGGRWTWSVDETGPTPVPAEARSLIGREIDAHVPGALHADLLAAGVIPDPLVDSNEDLVGWVSRCDWLLRRRIDRPVDAERIDLVFDGIDTVAAVAVNGHTLGTVRNMHRTARFDVSSVIADDTLVEVRFTSPYTEAEKWERELGARPSAYPEPFAFIRKMASSFGWDWGPTLPGCGLWRDVRLEAWSTARISAVRPLVDVFEDTGILTAHIDLERAASGDALPLHLEVDVAGHAVHVEVPPGESTATVVVDVPDVRRWFPRSLGEPHTYPVAISLWAHGERLDQRDTRVGFRTISVDRTPDDLGTPFVVTVNDRPLFIRGVNWIPESVFPGTVPAERVRARLEQAADANVDLVRVWGGGVYESDEFYDACDDLGLLVWQDFLFACAAYPEEEPIRSEVLAEARENIVRLSPHASLALWNGNNENLWMRFDKDWAAQPGGDLTWGDRYYLEWLPDLVRELDPTRPYTEGSPWSGDGVVDPNDVDHQTFHSWDAWNEDDYAVYRDSAPRFVSEFGWQGAATWRTLRDAITDDELRLDSDNVRHHQKAIDGHTKIARNLARHLPATADFDRWHLQTQWMQVEAVRTGVLHWRSNWPRTAGTIVWQLNDLWPVTSWSAIDSAGRCKPLYFAIRDMYAPRVMTIEPTDGGLELCIINDHDETWVGSARIMRRRVDGEVLADRTEPVSVAPRSVIRLDLPETLAESADRSSEFLAATLDGERALWCFASPRMPGASAPLDIAVTAVPGGLDIVVSSDGLARDILVQPDRIHPAATVDRGFTTVLPGESATFRVRAPERLDPEAARGAFVVSSLRDIIDPD
ncbi:glycoside hydrolase family 2 protein [Agromyces atrinae]|uniref:glycoside hydrolase family 2 protein n=1 Tax=Agromyces atrinae TaxID=592376 RepID=UPI001F563E02|nr:glycoside hydrolase family 2 protein [Agromyces atrinae]MCI2956108.1 glycoside hydrolase family 2 protein [Agromyces atrinae]